MTLIKELDNLGLGKHPENRQKISKLLGVSVSAVDHWYKKRNKPSIKTMLLIESLSGVSLLCYMPQAPQLEEHREGISTNMFKIRSLLTIMDKEKSEDLEPILKILQRILQAKQPAQRAKLLLKLMDIIDAEK